MAPFVVACLQQPQTVSSADAQYHRTPLHTKPHLPVDSNCTRLGQKLDSTSHGVPPSSQPPTKHLPTPHNTTPPNITPNKKNLTKRNLQKSFLTPHLVITRLSQKILQNDLLAATATLLFIFNPASIFHTAAYSEAAFFCCTTLGLWALYCLDSSFMAAAAFAASATFRSNGEV